LLTYDLGVLGVLISAFSMGPKDELATHDGVSGDLFFWTMAYLDATQNLHDRVDVMLSVMLFSIHVLMY
jgi:hypothetical protein